MRFLLLALRFFAAIFVPFGPFRFPPKERGTWKNLGLLGGFADGGPDGLGAREGGRASYLLVERRLLLLGFHRALESRSGQFLPYTRGVVFFFVTRDATPNMGNGTASERVRVGKKVDRRRWLRISAPQAAGCKNPGLKEGKQKEVVRFAWRGIGEERWQGGERGRGRGEDELNCQCWMRARGLDGWEPRLARCP